MTIFTPDVPTLEEKRESATRTRAEFLIAASTAGIITESVAEDAAGGAWPSEFNTFLNGLTGPQRIEAKATWADGQVVRRNNPILSLIATNLSLTDAEVDALFGISS